MNVAWLCYTPNEIRDRVGLGPIEGGAERIISSPSPLRDPAYVIRSLPWGVVTLDPPRQRTAYDIVILFGLIRIRREPPL